MVFAHQDFLNAVLRGDRETVAGMLGDPGWSWEWAIAEASEEALLPTIYSALKRIGLGHAGPAGFFESVEAANRERNEAIFSELRWAVGLLNAEGIEPVLLKGVAYLAAGVFEDPAHRYLEDIDLLVSEEQLPVAAAALRRNGYMTEGYDPLGHFRNHHPALRRPGAAPIELHDRLGTRGCEKVLPAREAIEQARPGGEGLGTARARIPSAEHLLTHLVMHSQMKHCYRQRIWPPLRALWDLVALDRHFGSAAWGRVEARFRRAGRERLLTLHLLRVREALGGGPEVARHASRSTDAVTGFLWKRRQLLRRYAGLRYADPVYMGAVLFGRRAEMFRRLMETRAGRLHLLAQVGAWRSYAGLWTDLTEGRGR